ncbi:MotA/TolQ/ExbB proton channel family protein [Gelidibacter algens]|uniref:MotA/TolQ/ExbB proton channel family protein n=1 Tax=Gelidibacter algens TaxID=49280 RepID=A0A1A7R397_9FLAO|nr:MotA/TolQ/ExbB proton channel family protein [Gelidibacter algens]OBX26311.1 hypothetical protein A9996_05945 [Gelidibacter algens]RAJ24800.1 MotA/TolQ/ExbB proton channel family protein [Gelidibacter algens]
MFLKLVFQNSFLMINPFVDRFNEGGPFMMTLILTCLILSLVFMVIGFRNLKKDPAHSKKMTRLIADVSLLGLVLGFFGSILGMIEAFDAIEGFNDSVNSTMIAGGLKVSFLTILFGCFVFIISRIGILILKGLQKP